MGVLRGFGIVICSVALFLILISAGTFATLNNSLTFENVQKNINPLATQFVEDQIGTQNIVPQLTDLSKTVCQNGTEIVKDLGNFTLAIPCETVYLGEESIISYSIDYFIKDFYYKEYNCKFADCFKESDTPFFLISLHAKNYWKGSFYKTFLAIIILTALLILLAEKKSNGLIIAGSLSIASSFIILKLTGIGTAIAKAIISPISQALSETSSNDLVKGIVNIFFSESTKVFLWMFIAGIIVIAAGIVLKLTGIGMKISQKIENINNKNKIKQLETKTKMLEKNIKSKPKK